MTDTLDLGAYFERIRWGGAARPRYEVLAGIIRAHMTAIPFENLDVLLGRNVRLDVAGLQDKLVRARRGGYCFEHAMLFAAVLERLGFHPVRHSARVILFASPTTSPRGHMFLTVRLAEGRFVVDVGFGAQSPPFPVPLLEDEQQRADDTTHWMARDADFWILRTKADGKTISGWVSTLEQDNAVDFEMANHYIATHPASPFVNRMLLCARTEHGRVTAMNRDVTIWRGNRSNASQLADRAALRALLVAHFGFDLPEVERLRVPSIEAWT